MATNRKLAARLGVERLEGREVPTSSPWFHETFDSTQPGQIPAGWSMHQSDPAGTFAVSTQQALASTGSLRTDGNSYSEVRAWSNIVVPADAQVSADFYLSSLSPTQVLLRGQGLDSNTPSYYSVAVTRGMQVQLQKVIDGQSTVLASLRSSQWISSQWARVTLTAVGDDLSVHVFRTDTAQYLNSAGQWQLGPTQAIRVTDGEIVAPGHAGLARSAQYSGSVYIDNFMTAPPPAGAAGDVLAVESFSRPVPGGLPAQWLQRGDNGAAMRVSTARSLTDTGGLRTATSGPDAVRAWLDAALPADASVSAAMFLEGGVAEILARGRNLASATPTYYALQAASTGLQIIRVVNGQQSVLAQQSWAEPIGSRWVQATLTAAGDNLSVSVYRADTAQYLNSQGQWQTTQTSALAVRDSTISDGGNVGVGRAAGDPGIVTFDNLCICRAVAPVAAAPMIAEPELPDPNEFQPPAEVSLLPGWLQWSNGPTGFAVAEQPSRPDALSLTSTGSSDLEARAWLDKVLDRDQSIEASIYLDSLVPSQLMLRGQKLDSITPSYYAVSVTRGLDVQVQRIADGQSTVLSALSSNTWDSNVWVRVHAEALGDVLQVQVLRLDDGRYLNEEGNWQADPATAVSVNDSALLGEGHAGVARPASYQGTIAFDDIQFESMPSAGEPGPVFEEPEKPPVEDQPVFIDDPVVDFDVIDAPIDSGPPVVSLPMLEPVAPPAGTEPSNLPSTPRHMAHIRIAQFAYHGTPIGSVETNLLKTGVDLVIPNESFVEKIDSIAPGTPQFLYSNASNIYRELLTDWLQFADSKGYSRESAFFHVTEATPFTGDSASAWPVEWFWAVYLETESGLSNKTSFARDAGESLSLGTGGKSLLVGNTEKFREINVNVAQAGSGGWAGRLEYAAAVNAAGEPFGWKPLNLIADGTKGFTQSGRITFDPPADWITGKVGISDRLFYVRIRSTSESGTAPVLNTLLGRDYVNARGQGKGVMPAFDARADRDGDGYLNDVEYSARRTGMDARFVYESRAFYPAYGQNRFATNVAHAQFREWAADYSYRYLQEHPNADGLFMDNSISKIALDPSKIAESLSNYAEHYAETLGAINARIAPRWVLANIAGGGLAVDALAQRGISYLEEFAIRPMAASYSQFEDVAENLKRRLELSDGRSYAILDSLATGGSMSDPRVQIGTLAYYYLLADPDQTMLVFNGGNAPNTTWAEHWSQAVRYNVGQPMDEWSQFAKGTDPANATMTFKVYQRHYDNALVLYKPLSYHRGKSGSTADMTATTHQLNGLYRPLHADGTLGAAVSRITLRNGEGAILVKTV